MTKSKGKASNRRTSVQPVDAGAGALNPRIAIAIMAAGKGTRLKSQLPKVLHEVRGKPLLEHENRAAVRVVPPQDVYAIGGHEADRVRQAVEHTGVDFVLQAEQRGTG